LRPLGTGGMATVYLAEDLRLGRRVAVKVLHRQFASDPAFVARFAYEARIAAGLVHPNIVQVHDVGHDGGRHYIVMAPTPIACAVNRWRARIARKHVAAILCRALGADQPTAY
jgi:serine/threonine protein kinase